MYGISYNKKTICSGRSNLLSEWRERYICMKKRSIWNKYGKKTAEYVNEWGKWYRFDTYADFGINIVVYIVMLCLPFALLIVGNSNIIQAIIYAIFMLPICWGVSYCNYMNMYTSMVRMGQYCLDEDGIKFDYFPNIHREVRWEEIELIERRTIEAISPKIENVIDRDIFFICKNGCTENEKKAKTRGMFFYAKHRKQIMLIGYSKEREEELRQYWDKEIRDQRKWTRGMNLF